MYPLFLELTDRVAVVVGGGTVGRRKAAALLSAGAYVRLICLDPKNKAVPRLTWIQESYRAAHLEGAALVFAAATPDVNQQVVSDARSRGLWVNDAIDPEAGDFFVPAVVRRGDFVIAIGTGGAAPHLARAVRERLETEFDDTFAKWVALLAEIRSVVHAEIEGQVQRRAVFERLCRWEWLDRLRREGAEAVRSAMGVELASLARHPDDPL